MANNVGNFEIINSGPVVLYAQLWGTDGSLIWDGSDPNKQWTACTQGLMWCWNESLSQFKMFPGYTPPTFPTIDENTLFYFGVYVAGSAETFVDKSRTWASRDDLGKWIATYKFTGGTGNGSLTWTGTQTDTRDIGSIVLKNNGPVELWPKFCQNSSGPLVWDPSNETQWKVLEGGQVTIGPDQRSGYPPSSGTVNLGVIISWSTLDPQDTSRGWNLTPEFGACANYEWSGGVDTGSLNFLGITGDD